MSGALLGCGGRAMDACRQDALGCEAVHPEGAGGQGQNETGVGGMNTGGAEGSDASGGGPMAGGAGGTVEGPPPVAPGDYACEPGILPGFTTRLLNWQYDSTVFDLFGVDGLEEFDGARPSELLNPDYLGPLDNYALAAYLEAATAIAKQVVNGASRGRFLTCDPSAVGCLEETIEAFGRKAYRRPLSAGEKAELAAVIAPDQTGDEAAVALLTAILSSPHFIEREILGAGSASGGNFQLTSQELAARLSYFLVGSTPDEELSQAADLDLLRTAEQVRAQSERLLASPGAARAVLHFHHDYLRITDSNAYWSRVGHDTEIYPFYTSAVAPSSIEELDAFFREIAFSGGTFSDLFLSNQGFVNAALAPLYGLNAADFGDELVPFSLDAEERPGFLTRVAFLSSYSRYQETNPIARGAFVQWTVLGINLPAPPTDLFPPPVPTEPSTNRQLIETLTSSEDCSYCHEDYINPPGFALENYDAVGTWQTVDRLGGPIDPVADVFFGDGARRVEAPLELMQNLAVSEHARRRYVDALVSYAFQRAPNSQDACISEGLMPILRAEEPLLSLWVELAVSEAFRVGGLAPK